MCAPLPPSLCSAKASVSFTIWRWSVQEPPAAPERQTQTHREPRRNKSTVKGEQNDRREDIRRARTFQKVSEHSLSWFFLFFLFFGSSALWMSSGYTTSSQLGTNFSTPGVIFILIQTLMTPPELILVHCRTCARCLWTLLRDFFLQHVSAHWAVCFHSEEHMSNLWKINKTKNVLGTSGVSSNNLNY